MSSVAMKSTTATASATAGAPKGGRKSASLPPETVEYLKAWMMSPEHVAHPYPTEQEKAQIMAETGIELKQLTNWFVNNRKRFWKPRVEAKLQKYTAPAVAGSLTSPPSHQGTGGLSISIHHMNPKPPPPQLGFPLLPKPSAASLYARGSCPSGPASPHEQVNLGPAAAAAGVVQVQAAAAAALHREDDPHTISEGSGSSACNSDDDSLDATSTTGRRSSFGAIAAEYLNSRIDSAGAGPLAGGATAVHVSGGYRRQEEVDVHVLRPDVVGDDSDEQLPTLRDLTIKASVPKERILATFKCPISYTIPYEIENDRKKVQSRRDGEVLRVKKHYLKLYLATRGIHSVSSPVGSDTGFVPGPPPSSCASSISSVTVPSTDAPMSTIPAVSPSAATLSTVATSSTQSRSCASSCTDLDLDNKSDSPPRKRARTASGSFLKGEDEWRELCQNAKSLFCESLPSLEEAAMMFGYVTP